MKTSAAPTVEECIEALRLGIVRARFIFGWRWKFQDTPLPLTLSGEERRDLGLLLDALHNVPDYIRVQPPDPVFASIVRRDLEQFARVHSRMLAALVGTPDDPSGSPPSMPALVDDFDDDGPFGPAHET
jgi:hypothetical protein